MRQAPSMKWRGSFCVHVFLPLLLLLPRLLVPTVQVKRSECFEISMNILQSLFQMGHKGNISETDIHGMSDQEPSTFIIRSPDSV